MKRDVRKVSKLATSHKSHKNREGHYQEQDHLHICWLNAESSEISRLPPCRQKNRGVA